MITIETYNKTTAIDGCAIAYDGCHKIYICQTEAEADDAEQSGYDIYDFNADELRALWLDSCDLRFIRTWASLESIVPQEVDIFNFK